MNKTLRNSALSAALLVSCAAADTARNPDDWAWSGTVYGWFPSIVGTTRFLD